MILRLYGETLQSVDINFDSKAFNEIGFRRNRQTSIPMTEFEAGWERIAGHELDATAEGDVQDHTQQEMLDALREKLEAIEAGLGGNEALRIENVETDWPKTRDVQKNVIVEGENRLRFHAHIAPPLRVAVWRRTG